MQRIIRADFLEFVSRPLPVILSFGDAPAKVVEVIGLERRRVGIVSVIERRTGIQPIIVLDVCERFIDGGFERTTS